MNETRTITLTQANEEGFDPEKFNFDIKNMSNVQVFRVLRVVELVNQGHLHYVKLEFNEGDVQDPKADPMIVGTISRTIEQTPEPGQAVSPKILDHQWRVMWDNKLWRPLDDDAATILEAFRGLKKKDVQAFAEKMASQQFRQDLQQKLLREAAQDAGWTDLSKST